MTGAVTVKKAVIGFGTNIGDRAANIADAYAALEKVPGIHILRKSSVYETEPWGFKDQAAFYNSVAEVETNLPPHMLLGACLGIEAGLGRVRLFKNGPRIIDLDLLVYEDTEICDDVLTVPHPRIGERAFVLVPLSELYCDMQVLGFDYKCSTPDKDGGIIKIAE